MKKGLALTLAACIAVVAIGFLYQNTKTQQAQTTSPVVSNSTQNQAATGLQLANNQQIATISQKEGPLSITAKKSLETPLEANEMVAENEVEDDDAGPMVNGRRKTKQERINEAMAHEFEVTKDPALGYVPKERLLKAVEQTRRLQAELAQNSQLLRGSISNARWTERGPGNVGGRTRAILVDRNDPTGKTVFCGSALGGLFKNTNITSATQAWERVNDWLDNLTISSIAQDPSNPKIMYIGSGDTDANDSRGLGISKSSDGGKTWTVLASTLGNGYFSAVPSIVVTPDNGWVYAATAYGIFRSKDVGATWEKVLGSQIGTSPFQVLNIQLGSDKRMYASTGSSVYKSTQNGDKGTWNILPTTWSGWSRTEIAVAPTDPNVIYAVGSINGAGSNVYRSSDGGTTWIQKAPATWGDFCSTSGGGEFTRGQAWYDLCIVVDPTNANGIWIGGVDMHRSLDGGGTWTQASWWAGCPNKKFAHADHHILYFDPLDPSVLYSGNDGGVFRVNDAAGNFTIDSRNNGFVTTLFYGCAIHADSAFNHFLAGAQDNGNLIVRGTGGISNTTLASGFGGDGFLTFIDQNEPDIQIGSSYNGVWSISTNGGASFGAGANSKGGFFCPADYDDKNNILYAQTTTADLFRWNLKNNTAVPIDLAGVSITGVSNIFIDENVDGRIYVGTQSGFIYRANGANVGGTIADVVQLAPISGRVSAIDVERGNPTHLLATSSSYGVQSVWESINGGTSWTSCDVGGNLPDMPVRWGIFNPNDGKSVLLGTDLGVWTTELLNGATTVWQPPTPIRGIPLVRTDRIEWRKSDKMLLAGTFGRGMWTSSALGKPQAVTDYQAVTYLDVPVPFKGDGSVAADRYKWLFGDNGAIDTTENTLHAFRTVGRYDVSLTINNDNTLKSLGKVQVLPDLPTPYKSTANVYAGNFDDATADVHFGAWNTSGSKWERGNSSVPGKAGTHSGSSAFILEKTLNSYKNNTTAYLQTPNFDMSKGGIYQFSFWSYYATQLYNDGFKVEYSLDKGLSWKQLGSNADANWYNYKNTSLTNSAFSIGESYIHGVADEWTRFKLNVSVFAGNKNVAFRFVFKSNGDNIADSGVALDDVVLSRFDGKLETVIINQGGAFDKAGTSINVTFQSQPEYAAKTFTVQKSTNGRQWEDVQTINATGISTEDLQEYTVEVAGTKLDLYYFRIKSVNADAPSNYTYSFITPPFSVRRDKNIPLAINKVFPSPFTNLVTVSFTDIVTSEVVMSLYDDIGRLIATQTTTPNGVFQDFRVGSLAKGIYFLTIKIGEAKPETTKLFGAGND
jgi:hypothetical protein